MLPQNPFHTLAGQFLIFRAEALRRALVAGRHVDAVFRQQPQQGQIADADAHHRHTLAAQILHIIL